MFKGPKPTTQPRSLRSVIEDKADSKNFVSLVVPDVITEMPIAEDVAEQAHPTSSRPRKSSADPTPFFLRGDR